MDKIAEKLKALGVSEEDLATVKESFDEAVDARVKAETNLISEKAEEYIAREVDKKVAEKTAELETLSEKYLEIKTATIAKNAALKLDEQKKEIEDACAKYIDENFEKAFAEKYEKELATMEESILAQLDAYLDYAINENISPDLLKNAAVNERDNARIRAQIAEEVEKVLAEYNYVEQAQKSFHGNLIALGIMKETYEQYAKRMQEEAKALAQKEGSTGGDVAWDLSLPGVSVQGKYKSPEQQLLQQFLSQGAKPYRVNPQNDRDLYVWLQNLMSNYDFDEEDNIRYHTEGWVQKGFPQLEEWVKDIEKYRPEIQKFYFSLINWEDEYYDAKKIGN